MMVALIARSRSLLMTSTFILSALLFSCSVGGGEGQVESDDLVVLDCRAGAYEMDPDYFASSPFEDAQLIRVQRGGNTQLNSDELITMVHSTGTILGEGAAPSLLGEPIEVRAPVESLPEYINPMFLGPPLVTMSLHLGQTCEEEVISLQAISGTITFFELYNGESNQKKKDRLIEAEFDVLMGDPRDVLPDVDAPSGYVAMGASRVTGWFRFYYRRGQPAQTFP